MGRRCGGSIAECATRASAREGQDDHTDHRAGNQPRPGGRMSSRDRNSWIPWLKCLGVDHRSWLMTVDGKAMRWEYCRMRHEGVGERRAGRPHRPPGWKSAAARWSDVQPRQEQLDPVAQMLGCGPSVVADDCGWEGDAVGALPNAPRGRRREKGRTTTPTTGLEISRGQVVGCPAATGTAGSRGSNAWVWTIGRG